MGVVETEHYFICEGPLYNDLRHVMKNKYICPVNAIRTDKFELIMSDNSSQALHKRNKKMYDRRYVTGINDV